MKYFAKYIPVEGEVKKRTGSTVCDGEAGVCLRENDNGFDYYQKVKMFLCSKDIQVGDSIQHSATLNPMIATEAMLEGGFAQSFNYFKVIGEISLEATWVKKGDEFDEEEVQQKTELYSWSKEYNTNKDFEKFFNKSLSKKATHFEYIGETDYLDEHGTINLNFKVFLKIYEIKGSCGHFH